MTDYHFFVSGFEKTPDGPKLWTVKASNSVTANFIAEMFRAHGLERVTWKDLEASKAQNA